MFYFSLLIKQIASFSVVKLVYSVPIMFTNMPGFVEFFLVLSSCLILDLKRQFFVFTILLPNRSLLFVSCKNKNQI